jgi:hypothetical protein
MAFLYLEALVSIPLAALMATAGVVQQRAGNAGWVEPIWTFSLGPNDAGGALRPVADAAPNARQWLAAALVTVWSLGSIPPAFSTFVATRLPSDTVRLRDQPGTNSFFPLPPRNGATR